MRVTTLDGRPNLVADRAALLGDAVHALDPSWAQGANMALQDAIALSNTIEDCFALDDFSASSLKGYERTRRTQAEFVQRETERTAKLATRERFLLLARTTGPDKNW